MSRPTRDQWAMELAQITAKRTTCLRRAVGAVFLNARGHILATGYNGVASGQPHCNELVEEAGIKFVFEPTHLQLPKLKYYPNACPGAQAPSGTQLDGCHAIHAEQNALLQCKDVYDIHTAYVTTTPCMTCTKLLLNTSCQRIVYDSVYPHAEAEALWKSSGRSWENYRSE